MTFEMSAVIIFVGALFILSVCAIVAMYFPEEAGDGEHTGGYDANVMLMLGLMPEFMATGSMLHVWATPAADTRAAE
jgi:hypothetical protein